MNSSSIARATVLVILAVVLTPCSVIAGDDESGGLHIGWGSANLTPDKPVIMSGGSRARLSTGVMDPLTATALVLEFRGRDGKRTEQIIMVSVDMGSIHAEMLDRVLELLKTRASEIDPGNVIINATHTHAAVERRQDPVLVKKFAELGIDVPLEWSWWGMDLGVRPTPLEYAEFASGRIADAIEQAWKSRKPGGVSFGLGQAVVGQNRLATYENGRSVIYGKTDRADFRNIEGYEDHSVGLLYTYDANNALTGVVINIACPAQVSEGGTLITADYWHETRNELRKRLGRSLHVLPQIAAAGDQSPHLLWNDAAEERMQKIMFPGVKSGRSSMGRRQQIAVRIADAVTGVLPYMKDHIDSHPLLAHRMVQIDLTRRRITKEEMESKAQRDFQTLLAQYAKMRREIEQQPERKLKPNWYAEITQVYWHLARAIRFMDRYELQHTDPKLSVPVHVVRIGDLAIATNPLELYVDYGIQIKARSKAVQTFTVQIANGYYRYLPTKRAVQGGAYGAIPESNEVDPEGGQALVERTIEEINKLWAE
jgi:hypothetical protein